MDLGCLKRHDGFGLVPVLIAAGILGIVMVGVASIFEMTNTQQARGNLAFQASLIRNTLINAINNSASWNTTIHDTENTLSAGVGLDCQHNGQPCTQDQRDVGAGGTPIGYNGSAPTATGVLIRKVLDSSGLVVLDTTAPNKGFTSQGTPCNSFNGAVGAGNDQCPLRFEVHWWASCSSITLSCRGAQPQLQIFAIYNPRRQTFPFNTGNFSTSKFLQGQTPDGGCWRVIGTSLVETCASFVGLGLANPDAHLHVSGDVAGGYEQFKVVNRTSSNNAGAQVVAASGINNNYAILGVVTNNPTQPKPYAVVSTGNGSIGGLNFVGGVDLAIPFVWTQGAPGPTSVERMRITETGLVGINNSMPSHRLDVNGDIHSTRDIKSDACIYAGGTSLGGVGCTSDQRLKEDVKPFELGLNELMGMRPVTFRYNGLAGSPRGGTRQIGVIAQELEAFAPQLVGTKSARLSPGDREPSSIKTVDYGAFTYVLINSVKTLHAMLKEARSKFEGEHQNLNRRLRELEAENEILRGRLDQLEKRIR